MSRLNQTLPLLLILASGSLSLLLAQSDSSLHREMTEANKAYQEQQFTRAIQLYEDLAQKGYQSVALFYNLGNAYFRDSQFGMARLQYERALLLEPREEMVLHNRSLLLRQLEDQIEEGGRFFLWQWRDRLMLNLGAMVWALLALFWAALSAAATGRLWWHPAWRKKWRSWTILGLTLLLFGLCLHLALARAAWKNSPSRGIISEKEVVLRVAPDNAAEELFSLHEGTELYFLDSLEGWRKVRLANQREGWLPAEVILDIRLPAL